MNIHVSQLDLQWNDEELRKLFAPHGQVQSAKIQIDAFTDKSRGFGYVEMPDEEQARAAIAALNQAEINGSKLKVQEAEPTEARKGSYKVGSGGINPYRFKKN